MVQVDLQALFGTLNTICHNALENAVGLAVSRTNPQVEPEHWLLKLLESSNSDLIVICRHFGVSTDRLSRELNRTLDGFDTGSGRGSAVLSPQLQRLAQMAWLIASVDFGSSRTRSGHLLCALLADETLGWEARRNSKELARIPEQELREALPKLITHSGESADGGPTPATEVPARPGTGTPAAGSALDRYTVDLTARAKQGEIDPVIGRDAEIRQMVDILTRRRQNNPILVGEAGVGKTALAEGLALRVAAGDVPPVLENVAIRTLDLALLQAGAGIRGEFENRLKEVINGVKASLQPIVLFIDEAHTLIGAGGQAGQGDAANLLKPALARGELRTIAATTWAEYKQYIEGDAALARRFQPIKVEEPGEPATVEILQGLTALLEQHHGVRILDEALEAGVHLSHRYISGRQLPDKAVSLLDTTCARVALSHNTVPPAIEDIRRRIRRLSVASGLLQREAAAGADHRERLTENEANKAGLESELALLEQRWQQERELVGQIRDLRAQLESDAVTSETDDQRAAQRQQMRELNQRLTELQGEQPLIRACVDAQAVAEVVSAWTGIPVGRMMVNEINAVLSLKERMEERIIGQSHALETIAQHISTARANLADPRRPMGVFLLVGPSGVGKTETAITLANLLYGGDQNMTVINMSEFKEEHKVSLLMGSPPGYVGYREGGVLTEAVRRRPYSVVLLDEIEKAHSGVQDIFYQVFDKGILRDGEGRDIDFKNTIILMTSNAGTETIMKQCADPETAPESDALAEALRPELLEIFKPALLGRVTLIPYYPLSDDVLRTIIELQLQRVAERVQAHYRAAFSYSPELVGAIAARCREVESGARNVDHILSRTLLPELSATFLARMAAGEAISAVAVSTDGHGGFLYDIH